MPYLPPKFWTIHCRYLPYVDYPYERVVAYIRDANGNIVASYEYEPLGETGWFCAKIRTPDNEGVYAIDFRVYDQTGKQVANPSDRPLVVSTELSTIGMAMKIINFIEEHVYSRIDCISNCESKLSELLTETGNYLSEAKLNAFKVLGRLRDVLYWEILNIKKILEEVKEKLDSIALPTLDSITKLLDKIRPWLKKRIA